MAAWQFQEDDEISRLTVGRAEALNRLFRGISNGFGLIYTKEEIDDLEFGTDNIADNSVTLAKLQRLPGYSVAGNLATTGEGPVHAVPVSNDAALTSGSPSKLVTEYAVKTFVTAAAFSSDLPAQPGNAGRFISTDGTNASWTAIAYGTVRPFVVATGNFNAVAGARYLCSTAGGAITVTLPANPAGGDSIAIKRQGANAVIVARNGRTIAGLNEDMTMGTDKREAILDYWNNDWIVSARATT